MSAIQNQLVNDLREGIMDGLSGEHVAIQIKVAFTVLVSVMNDAIKRDPDEAKGALAELRWPLQPDARMTVLINLLADQTAEVAENDDQVDAIVEALRRRLKQRLAT